MFGWQLLQIGLWGDDDGLLAEARTQRKSVLAWHGSRPGGRPPRSARAPIRWRSLRTRSTQWSCRTRSSTSRSRTRSCARSGAFSRPKVISSCSASGRCRVGACGTCSRSDGFPPGLERMIGEGRLRDWLKLLGFEIVDARRYLFTLPWGSSAPSSQSFFERSGAALVAAVRGRLPDEGAQARLHPDADPAALAAAAESRGRTHRADHTEEADSG